MAVANTLLQLAMGCGLRESGVVPSDTPLCAIRSAALKIDAPLAANGQWMVTPEYVHFIVALANKKMDSNQQKLEKCAARALALPPPVCVCSVGRCPAGVIPRCANPAGGSAAQVCGKHARGVPRAGL